MSHIEVHFQLDPVEPYRDILLALLSTLNFESFEETTNGLKAYVSKSDFDATYIEQLPLLQSDECKVSYSTSELEAKNWNEVWEQNFEPMEIGEVCYIRAEFHSENKNFPHEIVISPKMAFGTGHHATTYQMVERIAEMDMNGKEVLDMGCGTGVLAIFAAQRGAAKVHAVDIDEWSIVNTHEHLKRNNAVDITVDKGGAEVLEGLTFNVILANINKNVLLADIKTYSEALRPDGTLILSGFYKEDVADLIQAGEAVGLSYENQTERNRWATIRMKKENSV